jgi:L-gulono-1,4-lactone dehydrogenase
VHRGVNNTKGVSRWLPGCVSFARVKCLHTNFGGNQTWESRCYRPASEAEVLEILDRHGEGRIRAVGSKHSWSDIAAGTDVSLDMSRLDEVRLYEKDGAVLARVGAGCRLQALLERLHGTSERTLPTLGAIKRQTISGAVSTGTHGSGTQSLSHFVAGARIAAYDAASGKAKIFEYSGGDELRAARCGLGCTGILLSLDVVTVPKYKVRETITREASLDRVLRRYPEYSLTQFGLVPYAWTYLVFERRPQPASQATAGEYCKALLHRLYNTIWVDVLFHLGVKASIAAGSRVVKAALRLTPRLLLTGVSRVDDAEHVLTLGHYYFRHEEMELFVAESQLAEALEVLRYATEVFAGEASGPAAQIQAKLEAHGLHEELLAHRGSYTQHYPFFIRRLLPEDTLVSMGASIIEPLYSISVFTYHNPGAREAYYRWCGWLARCMSALFAARLHWGKHFPLGPEATGTYPRLQDFRRVCLALDPHGVFRNAYTARVLRLP